MLWRKGQLFLVLANTSCDAFSRLNGEMLRLHCERKGPRKVPQLCQRPLVKVPLETFVFNFLKIVALNDAQLVDEIVKSSGLNLNEVYPKVPYYGKLTNII